MLSVVTFLGQVPFSSIFQASSTLARLIIPLSSIHGAYGNARYYREPLEKLKK